MSARLIVENPKIWVYVFDLIKVLSLARNNFKTLFLVKFHGWFPTVRVWSALESSNEVIKIFYFYFYLSKSIIQVIINHIFIDFMCQKNYICANFIEYLLYNWENNIKWC